MKLEMIGINHETSDIATRDQAAIIPEKLPSATRKILNIPGVNGVVIVSTCNRVEIYISPDKHLSDKELRGMFAEVTGLGIEQANQAYIWRDEKTAEHLFRVASGLNSQLVGEVQILGQVKDSYHAALELGCSSGLLNRLFLMAVECGKLVRERTAISQGAVSVSYAAADLAGKIFGKLDNLNVLIIGAGDTGQLTGKYLAEAGVTSWRVCNRTRERGEKLAQALSGSVVPFPPLAEDIQWADIVISATGAPDLVIRKEMVLDNLRKRRNPICFFDLAVPRDIDPELKASDDIYVYSVDDFQELVHANLRARRKEASRAERYVAQKIQSFVKWYRESRVAPTIHQLREILESIRQTEVEKAARRFCMDDRKQVEKFSKTLMKKVINILIMNMKQASVDKDDLSLARAVLVAFAAHDKTELDKALEKLDNELSH